MPEFKKLFEEPKGPKKPYVPSRALVACMGGTGCVLEYVGDAITWHVQEFSSQLDELGLDDAPDGLSIWEGSMGSRRVQTQDGDDWDYEVNGEFRDLKPEEWDKLKAGEDLWSEEEKRDSRELPEVSEVVPGRADP